MSPGTREGRFAFASQMGYTHPSQNPSDEAGAGWYSYAGL